MRHHVTIDHKGERVKYSSHARYAEILASNHGGLTISTDSLDWVRNILAEAGENGYMVYGAEDLT